MWKVFSRSVSFKQLLNTRTFPTVSSDVMRISDEVSQCLQAGGPVVALESTIITHGMPYPDNLRTALKVEEIVRQNGATPATIGVVNGKVCVGLSQAELEVLALKDKNFLKISRRDLPYVLSKGLTGGTTVAATMLLSYRAGINIFVTGGIGGVHRGGEMSMDVSADLIELSRTPMTVVSAGIKSILDIGRTLEVLETHGVCVASFGPSKEFPAFFSPNSGFKSPCNVESVSEAAHLIVSRDALQLESGILIGVPIPEDRSVDGRKTEEAIKQALKDARDQNIEGRDVTPFVLSRVNELSDGASLRANVALVESNASIGSLIAVEVAQIKRRDHSGNKGNVGSSGGNNSEHLHQRNCPENSFSPSSSSSSSVRSTSGIGERPVIVGGSILDFTARILQDKIEMNGSTHAGRLESCCGGVGRNVADCLSHLRLNPLLISAIGDDSNGDTLLAHIPHMDTRGISRIVGASTAVYAAILDKNGECVFGIGDMDVHSQITVHQVKSHEHTLVEAPLVAIDGNIPLDTMDYMLHYCSTHGIPVWFEPTDFNKAAKPFQCKTRTPLAYASPNLNELRAMSVAAFGRTSYLSGSEKPLSILEECVRLSVPLMDRIQTLLVTLGALGVLLITSIPEHQKFPTKGCIPHSKEKVRAIHYLPPEPSKILSVSGAGDCFAAAVMGAVLDGRWDQDQCIRSGQNAARLSLASLQPVPHSIRPETVFEFQAADFPYPQSIKML